MRLKNCNKYNEKTKPKFFITHISAIVICGENERFILLIVKVKDRM